MSKQIERGWYSEDDIQTKYFEAVDYSADFNNLSTVLADKVKYTANDPVTSSYIKVGKMVFVSISVDFSKVTAFGDGQYYVSLPFEAARHAGLTAGMLHEGTTKIRVLAGRINKESQQCALFYLDNQVEYKPFTNSAPHNITNDDMFHIEGWYEAVEY